MLWRGSDPHKGSYFYRTPGQPRVPFQDLKKNIEPHLGKGLLGGLDIPALGEPVAQAVKTGNLGAARAALARLPKSGSVGEFRRTLEERFEVLRRRKRALFDELLGADKDWQAYKVGSSYLRCFPKADDAGEMKRSIRSLKSRAAVKDNLVAKQAFVRVASMAYGSRGKVNLAAQAKATLAQIAVRYPDTEYGQHAAELMK